MAGPHDMTNTTEVQNNPAAGGDDAPRPPGVQERIESCQGLVRSIALSIFERLHRQYELDDLIASGLLGLTQAARDFDPARGAQFSTFAYHRIRGEIYDGIGRMGARERQRIQENAAWNSVMEAAADPAQGAASDAPVEGARWFQGMVERLATSSLLSGGDEVADERTDPPWARLCRAEIAQKLNELLNSLPDDARQLLQMAYFEGLSLQDAGERLGISRSWASRLHAKALQLLGQQLKQAGLEGE